MEAKDLVLLMLMPMILASLVFYVVKSPAITGAIVSEQKEESNIIGTYSVIPSFKARIDYSLKDEYTNIQEKLNETIDNCKDAEHIAQCFKDYADKFGWNCVELKDEAADILYDFVDKFNECLNLEENGVVCRFSLDERSILNLPNTFDITLTNENQRTRAEVRRGTQVFADYINMENLFYTGFTERESSQKNANPVKIIIEYPGNKPVIKEAFVIGSSPRIDLSKTFLVYKAKNGVKFIDSSEEKSFFALDPEGKIGLPKIIDLPKIKGFKFCAKTGKQFYAYDKQDKTLKLRDVVYRFAVTYSK